MQQKFPARPHLVEWQGGGYQLSQVAVMSAGKYVPDFQNINIIKHLMTGAVIVTINLF